MTGDDKVQVDLSLRRSTLYDENMETNNFIGPILPTDVKNSTMKEQNVTAHSKKGPSKPRRAIDVTKSRRYQNSLSFILGTVAGEELVSSSCSKDKGNEEGKVVKISESALNSSSGSVVKKVSQNTENNCKSQPENFVKTSTEPKNISKRPCPHKFTRPTLKKTTSALFAKTTNNYLKGCKWSPDGLALLTCSRDKIVRIFNIPDIASTQEQHPVAQHSTANIPYDFAWNPAIDHLTAKNCNFLVSCKDSPVQLVNAFNGQTMASYTAFNNVEVLVSAFSVCYMSPHTLLGGYCKHVRVFDVSRPGRECTEIVVGDLAHQNNNSIVSTVARHPTIEGVFGAGCYNTTVALYSTQIQGPLMPFYGPQHGVTQIVFSRDGTKLYCGSRMEGEIYCFDTRYNGSILQTYRREVHTNQRLQFDVNRSETLLVSGNHDGTVVLFDMARQSSPANETGDETSRELKFEAHRDTVNGVSFHPYWGILATSSGRRHFHIEDSETEENALKIWAFEN